MLKINSIFGTAKNAPSTQHVAISRGIQNGVILASALISFSPHFLEGGLGAIWATRGAQDGSRATQKQPKRPPRKSKGKS